jgi:hypothetical protein
MMRSVKIKCKACGVAAAATAHSFSGREQGFAEVWSFKLSGLSLSEVP